MTDKMLSDDLYKAIMPPEQYAEWKRRQEVSREFWRTLQGPAQRPLGSNADEWHLFLSEHTEALPYLAVQIAEAIEDAERRGRAQVDAMAARGRQ
jgi:hypothetical protein